LSEAGDFVTFSHLFAKNGQWSDVNGGMVGPAAIQAFWEKNFGPASNRPRGYHLMSNIAIDIQGDKATARSRWTVVMTGADKRPVIPYAGHFDDTLVREDGHWKFERRRTTTDLP
jgi:hypothetical protein